MVRTTISDFQRQQSRRCYLFKSTPTVSAGGDNNKYTNAYRTAQLIPKMHKFPHGVLQYPELLLALRLRTLRRSNSGEEAAAEETAEGS